MKITTASTLLACATLAYGQGFGGYGGDNPYSNGGDNNNGDGDGNNLFSGSGFSVAGYSLSHYELIIIVHAALASFAFVILFPIGAILIRLGSFRGVWLVHGMIQFVAYMIYIAAFGLGIYLINSSPIEGMINDPHPIIGIVLLVVLFFHPFSGFLHHVFFKKHGRRAFVSYVHIWIGRIAITLGIINGGLGLQFARRYRLATPSDGAIAGYSVVAGTIWLIYLVAVIVGERRRSAPSEKESD